MLVLVDIKKFRFFFKMNVHIINITLNPKLTICEDYGIGKVNK